MLFNKFIGQSHIIIMRWNSLGRKNVFYTILTHFNLTVEEDEHWKTVVVRGKDCLHLVDPFNSLPFIYRLKTLRMQKVCRQIHITRFDTLYH